MNRANTLSIGIPNELNHNWGWFLALGIALGILGVLAIVRSTASTVASMYFFGGLMLAAAAIEAVDAVMVGPWSGLFLHMLGAILFGVTGLLLLRYPLFSAEGLTAVMAMYFIVSGLFRVIAPIFVHLPNAGWHVLDGVVSLALGAMILSQWPISGLWAIGTFIGIALVLRGIVWSSLALTLRHRLVS